ncbi:MAG: hypothetical protein HON55_03395 [Legionellales bacterium]|jgi:mevalonate kinase|nr:hypothetical protein [Legionellales bacterium]
MNGFSTSCCAKTFFLGEYGALTTKRALLILTEPCFRAEFSLNKGERLPVKTSLPCQKFIASSSCLENVNYKFIDPYEGIGGLGASSAEFLFWLRAASFFSGKPYDFKLKNEIEELLAIYQKNSWSGEGAPPSGLDLIAQNYSGLVYIDMSASKIETLSWPFKGAGFCLAHTNKKLATHEHLENISDPKKMAFLSNYADDAWQALSSKDLLGVSRAINESFRAQADLGMVASHTITFVGDAMSSGLFVAAKGCGAMGADIVLFIYEIEKKADAVDFIKDMGLKVVATENNMR